MQSALRQGPEDTRRAIRPWLGRGLWLGVVLLVTIGGAAATARGIFPADLTTRLEPFRERVLDALLIDDPFALERAEQLDRFDRRFAAHPSATLLHVVLGGLFLVLAPLQFSARLRSRHLRFHRWSGRALLVAALVTASTGLFFGLLMPYGGAGEATAIALFGGLFVFAAGKAIVAIRRRQVARHREWMIRAFAIALAVSTVRIVGPTLDLMLTPAGFRLPEIFVLSLWTGWTLTVGAAELWIRYTRPDQLTR